MSRSMQIAVAVAAALGASGAAFATPPTLAQAASAPVTLYVAGSSAAKNGIINALQLNLCGGTANALTISSGNTNTNFFAVSCAVASSTGLSFAGQIATVYYRDEGGSVVGALPIVSKQPINQLNLSDTTNVPCPTGSTACTATVGGSSASNGTTDTFSGAVVKKAVQLGITDLEPAVFVGAGDNYPSAYSTAVFGKATPAQMASLSSTSQPLFQQVFGLFVNVNSTAFGTTKPTSLNISKAALTNILQGAVGDWSQVSDINGNQVASSSLAVTIQNRESGSGSRAGAAIYFTGDECNASAVTVSDPAGAGGDFFSTGNVLTAANGTAGSITYASIDNFSTSSLPNLVLVNIDGVAPSNLNAATGQYDYWFEATAVPSPTLTGNSATLSTWLIGELQTEATAPHLTDVNAIPLLSTNNPALPVSSTANTLPTGGVPIYVNQFTRGGSSCNTPSDDL
jgi:hypothetical protein